MFGSFNSSWNPVFLYWCGQNDIQKHCTTLMADAKIIYYFIKINWK